ncbi:hypothetical protein [Pseudomonas sp. BBP2017]|nr:hypothetical protein [Pseudomonas sp. BBP2017]
MTECEYARLGGNALINADEALYQAKHEGKHRYVPFSPAADEF